MNSHMKILTHILIAILVLAATPARAQEGLEIARLFEKYGSRDSVTMVEMNGSILRSYDMTMYRSLTFKNVKPYLAEIQQSLQQAVTSHQTAKRQEVVEDGQLMSAYYQLSNVRRKGRKTRRYILFKQGQRNTATLIYIEGALTENELMEKLYGHGRKKTYK